MRQRLAQAASALALACCLGGMAPAALAQSSSAAAPSTKPSSAGPTENDTFSTVV